jgi:2-octaprenyl-6-methoxyphenol hydroxylase
MARHRLPCGPLRMDRNRFRPYKPGMSDRFEIAIVGAGAVGLAAGIGFARAGLRVAVIGTDGARRDGRTVALMETSLHVLDRIGLRRLVEENGAPLIHLRIIDDTGRLLRAPPVTFDSAEIGLSAFGMNVEAAALVEMIAAAADQTAGLTRIRENATAIESNRIVLTNGRVVEADLLVGADGRQSMVRKAAGIGTKEWTYDQTAVTAIFAHDRSHRDTSTEFHTAEGPFTLVPLPGKRSSLVWLCKPERAARLMALDDLEFARAVEDQAQSMLGAMRLDGPRGAVPMGGVSVHDVVAPGVALAGEAAHVFPPIGAQGLNLGLRDVADLLDAFSNGVSETGFARYRKGRLSDIAFRTNAVDALNRSLLAGFLPLDVARSMGLTLLGSIGPLRRFVMRQGLGSAR